MAWQVNATSIRFYVVIRFYVGPLASVKSGSNFLHGFFVINEIVFGV